MPTYQEVLNASRDASARRIFDAVDACTGTGTDLGLSAALITQANSAMGIAASSGPGLAAYYWILASGAIGHAQAGNAQLAGQALERFWPGRGGCIAQGLNGTPPNPEPGSEPPAVAGGRVPPGTSPIDTDTLLLIGGGLLAILFVKKLLDG